MEMARCRKVGTVCKRDGEVIAQGVDKYNHRLVERFGVPAALVRCAQTSWPSDFDRRALTLRLEV